MSEPRILILDSDTEQARALADNLRFIDHVPEIAEDPAAIAAGRQPPRSRSVVILGKLAAATPLPQFIDWLRSDPQ